MLLTKPRYCHVPVGKMALLLIDLQKAHRHQFSYGHGTVEEGIRRTVELVHEARKLCIPLLFAAGENTPELIPEIHEAAQPDARLLKKRYNSAFTNTELLWILNECRIDILVVGGWARHLCVRETVFDAINEGFFIMGSDQIVFGKLTSQDRMLSETERRNFGEQLYLYPTLERLIEAMHESKDETEKLRSHS